ncbi:MAG: rod shape-determining protein MreC [Patescibacteria group bacterium]|jgi:rod shape-determining protein MreC
MSYKTKIAKNKVIVFVAVIGLLIFLHFLKITSPAESVLTYIFNPFFSGFYSFSTSLRTQYNEQMDKRDLVRLMRQMEIERNQLMVDNAKLKTLEDENESLRKYLSFFENNKYQYVMAAIIGQGELSDLGQGITINKGSVDGLSAGLAVMNSQGIIVGKVAEVKDRVSRLVLTTNGQCKFAAAIQNANKTVGITQGDLGLTIKMDYIPQTESIKSGDIIVTSGLEKGIPRGLVIGRISEVKQKSNELWQTAVIEPVINLNELVIVSVLLP